MTRRVVLVLSAFVLLLLPSATAHSAVGQFATGVQPDVVTDADGTSHVVWASHASGAGDSILYCRLPAGATACAAGSQKTLAGPRTDNNDERPFIVRLSGGRLAVYWGSGAPAFAEVYLSTDNGAVWSTVNVGGSPTAPSAVEAGPSDTLALLFSDGATIRYRSQPVTPGGGGIGGGVAGSATAGPRDLALTTGGKPFAGFGTGSSVSWNGYEGAGNGGDDAGWGAPTEIPGAPFLDGPRLASLGDAVWLSYEDTSKSLLQLVRLTDGLGSTIPFAGGGSGDGDLDGDVSGLLHYAYVKDGNGSAICYSRSATPAAWDRAPIHLGDRPAGTDLPLTFTLDAAGDGVGHLVYDTGLSNGPLVTATLAATSLTPNPCGSPPSAAMQGARATSPTAATLAGSLDGKLQPTTAEFLVGDRAVAANVSGASATATVDGLVPGATYSVALRATNSSGTVTSPGISLTMPGAGPPCDAAAGCIAGPPPLPPAGDLCPASPAGRGDLVNGCPAAALIATPSLAVESAQEAVDSAEDYTKLRTIRREYRPAASLIKRADRMLAATEREIEQLDTCDAADDAAAASRHLRGAGSASARAGRAVTKRLATAKRPRRGGTPSDRGPTNAQEYVIVEASVDAVQAASRDARAVATAMRKLCRQTRKARRVTGEVVSVSLDGTITLEGSRTVSLAGLDARIKVPISGPVTATGPVIGGVVYAEKISVKPGPTPPAPPPSCAKLAVRPVKGARQYGPLPVEGYETSPGRLLLEAGTGLHALPACIAPAGPGKRYKYFLQVAIKRSGGTSTWVLESGKEVPASLFTIADAGKELTVTVTEIAFACSDDGKFCGDSQTANPPAPAAVIGEKTYIAKVVATGAVASATLGETVFSIADRPGAFGKVTPLGLATNGNPLPNASLIARARRLLGLKGDFGEAVLSPPEEVVDGAQIPIVSDSHPHALIAPMVVGKRNGFTYAYSASQPTVITDLVAKCNRTEENYKGLDAYFLLPWTAGERAAVTQGAKDQATISHGVHPSDPTSGGYWAWDLAAGTSDPEPAFELGDDVRASRGGIVKFVYEDNNTRGSGAINQVIIEHQDGSAATYGHMAKDSIPPKAGDRVRRGQALGKMDWIGWATGPHVHISSWRSFAPDDPKVESSHGALFAGLRSSAANQFKGPFEPESCGILSNGEVWESTNTPYTP